MSVETIYTVECEVVEVSANGAENWVALYAATDIHIKIEGLTVPQAQAFGRLLYQKVRVAVGKIER